MAAENLETSNKFRAALPGNSSAFKLGDSKDNLVPEHFETLVNNTIKSRWKLLESKTIQANDFPLSYDLLCCVSLVTALEEGFRLDEFSPTHGFDIRVLRNLKSLPPFRGANNTYRMDLKLPAVLDLQFILLIIPIGDCAMVNFMAIGKNQFGHKVEAESHSTSAIHLPKFIEIINEGCARFFNIRPLSHAIRTAVVNVKHRVLSNHNIVVPASLLGLPTEVKTYLFKFLKPKDFLAVTSTNGYLHSHFAYDDELWRYYLKRDMKIVEISGVNPLQAYKTWHRRSPSPSRPMRSISELSSVSTSAASHRSQPRSEPRYPTGKNNQSLSCTDYFF